MAERRPAYYGAWDASADSDTYSETGSEGGPSPPTPVPEGMTVGVKRSAVYTTAGVGDPRVVLSVKAVRGAAPADLIAVHDQILEANSDEMLMDAVLLAFQSRDIRGGKGERAIFQTLFQNIARHHPLLAENLVDLVPEYGSWRDVFTLATQGPALQKTIFKLVTDQLRRDEATAVATRVAPSTREFAAAAPVENAAGVSLLAKWAPREGNAQDGLAKALAAYIWTKDPDFRVGNGANASYRKRMAALNRVIKTTEVYECANRWDEIDPKRVPARAREIKMAAYLNEKVQTKEQKRLHEPRVLRKPDDEKRMACREHFQAFFQKAADGQVKISGAETLYPHELVEKMWRGGSSTDELNAWNAVWTQMVVKARDGGGLGSSIAMCDFSGSMSGTPYYVSMAMGLLISSVNAGPFKNKFMTFDSNPVWHQVPADATLQTVLDTIRASPGIGQGTSTDFQKAMDLVLQTLRDNQTPAGEEPKNLIVITDMGWDAACGKGQCSYYTSNHYQNHWTTKPWETHLDAIKASFKRGGWEPPRIVIWNVAAQYSSDFHAQADTPGVIMLSGWSPSLFKILCEEGPRCITPYDALRAQLDDKRYDAVRQRVQEWLKGGWRGVA